MARGDESAGGGDPPMFELIELLFFAYRDFVGDADRILAEYGLGRAHHRVLHFVTRRPGMPIADLLTLLRITKQSLNRVLKDLVERELVEQRTGTADRRQRPLFATERGRALATRLAALQTRRLRQALPPGPAERGAITGFLELMVDDRAAAGQPGARIAA